MIFINLIFITARFSKVTHCADDTNLLLVDKSLKKINKHVNHDLALITVWLRANKISLNTSKTRLFYLDLKEKLLLKN